MKFSALFLFIISSNYVESFSPTAGRIPELVRQTKPLFTTSIKAEDPANPSNGEESNEMSQEELWQLQLQSEEVKVSETQRNL